jgi:hypothetical protein
LIQERIGNTLELVGIGKNFLNGTPAAQQLRDSTDKWDFIKLKSFCSSKETVSKIQMAEKHMKKCSPSLAIKEIQIKTTLRFHLTPVRIAIMSNTTTNRC